MSIEPKFKKEIQEMILKYVVSELEESLKGSGRADGGTEITVISFTDKLICKICQQKSIPCELAIQPRKRR